VGVVASSTSQSRVLGIVAAAVEQAIRLKSHVVDAPQVGHHRHGVHAAMASPAELLRKSFGIKLFRIENVQALSGGQEHHCGMAPSRSVAGLAGHAGNQSLQLKLGVDHRGGAVTAETIARFIDTDVAAGGLLQARRRIEEVSDRPVQSIDRRVIAHAGFIKLSVAAVDISLGDMGISKRVKNRLPDGLFSVAHTIRVLLAIAYDLVGVRPGLKSHPRVGSQHIALGSDTQGMPHRRVGLPAALLRVTTRASLSTRKAFARHLLPRTKMGEIGGLVGLLVREGQAGKKKQAQSDTPEGKQASYLTRKNNSPVSSQGGNTNQMVPIISQRLPVPPAR